MTHGTSTEGNYFHTSVINYQEIEAQGCQYISMLNNFLRDLIYNFR